MYLEGMFFKLLIFLSTWEWTNMFVLCKCIFISIAAIQIKEKYCDTYFDRALCALLSCLTPSVCLFQVSDLDDEAGSPTEEFKAFAGDSGMNRSQSEYCNVGSKTSLTNHPAKKYVFDFMRVLIMDNLCMTPASKQTPIVDMLLEVRILLHQDRWTCN